MRWGRIWLPILILALVALPAASAPIMIRNGLGPPNPENVIDAGDDLPLTGIAVLNVGCEYLVWCTSPGAPTHVEIREGAFIRGSVTVHQSSSVLMTGGTIPRDPDGIPEGPQSGLGAGDYASITITGGAVGALVLFAAATGAVSGGTIVSIDVTGRLFLRGGAVERVLVYGGGVVAILGSDFAINGVPVGLGSVGPGSGRVTGTLASGEVLALDFERSVFGDPPSGSLLLVPEPASAALLAAALLALAVRERAVRRS